MEKNWTRASDMVGAPFVLFVELFVELDRISSVIQR
jgi:hypothetical protein